MVLPQMAEGAAEQLNTSERAEENEKEKQEETKNQIVGATLLPGAKPAKAEC